MEMAGVALLGSGAPKAARAAARDREWAGLTSLAALTFPCPSTPQGSSPMPSSYRGIRLHRRSLPTLAYKPLLCTRSITPLSTRPHSCIGKPPQPAASSLPPAADRPSACSSLAAPLPQPLALCRRRPARPARPPPTRHHPVAAVACGTGRPCPAQSTAPDQPAACLARKDVGATSEPPIRDPSRL